MVVMTAPSRTFVFEDTKKQDYRYIRAGLVRRGWQQIAFPRGQPREGSTPKRDGGSHWVYSGGAMGVSSVGQKYVACPDLIWTRSGRSLGKVGPDQATNFFDSSCLTTKAGLCRVLQSPRCGSSENDETVGPSQAFFPRCFDLSDSSQLDDFKDNFRQTAAAAVLKVLCRLWTESPYRAEPKPPAEGILRQNHHQCDAIHRSRFVRRGSVEGPSSCGCLRNVHSWVLALAVRACRRHLLEASGWQENRCGDNQGASSDSNGARPLSDREWESLLLYSYVLRRVAHTVSDSAGQADATSGQNHTAYWRMRAAREESEDKQETIWGCDDTSPAGVGLGGRRCLRGTSTRVSRDCDRKRALRPLSAPANRNIDIELSRRRQTRQRDDALRAGCTRAQLSTAPGNWGPAEIGDLLTGLSKIWSQSGLDQSTCCTCPCGLIRGGDWKSGGSDRHNMAHLELEASQLCATFAKRCPQWTIDGERNLWMLKPAGASRGQGVRVAWTLDQVLCAQQTMGGRVVQKYVEAPLLLPRLPRQPGRPKDSPCLQRGVHLRRHPQLRCSTIHGEDTLGVEPCERAPGWEGGRSSEARSSTDKGEAVKTRSTESSDRSDVVKTEPTPLNGETLSSSGNSNHRSDDDTCSYTGDTEPSGIDSGSPTGARKFDIRTWVLVTAWDPLESFVFDESYLRVCPQSFTLDESMFTDPQVHLTNLSARRRPVDRSSEACQSQGRQRQRRGKKRPSSASVSRRATSYGGDRVRECRSGEGPDASEGRSETFVASQAKLFRALGEIDEERGGGRTRGEKEEHLRARGERLWRSKVSPSIEGIVRSTLLAAQPHVRPRARSFQLFGFDILLDRQLHPWLLEVNLSPALSHSSGHQREIISSMCEGLLRLTVDRIFPAPQAVLNTGADNEDIDSDAFESVDAPGAVSNNSEVDVDPSRRFGRWRPVTKSRPGSENKQAETSSSSSAAGGRFRNPSAQMFSLRGRHLTKRSLARAERGVREASAVRVLAVWWRSTAEERRENRSRKLRAIAEINSWLIRLVARRRRIALRVSFERAARVIQSRWRRQMEGRRLATRITACAVVQAAWRHQQLKRRCHFRLVRRRAFSGLQRWGRSVLSQKKTRAGKTILRAVLALTARKRKAAAVIARGLKTAGNRRRRSRLRLQRFARMPCLLHTRLTALHSARFGRSRSKAAEVIVRALRKAALESTAAAHASYAVRKLQFWCRRVLRRWKRRSTSSQIIQQAWRRARRRRGRATARLWCTVGFSPRHDSAVADESLRQSAVDTDATKTLTTTSVRVRALVPTKLALHGHQLNATTALGSALSGSAGNPDRSEYAHMAEEEDSTHGLPVPIDEAQRGNSLVFCEVSPATTMREGWTDPDVGSTGGDAWSCRSPVSEDGSLSCIIGKKHRERVTTMPESGPYPGNTPRIVVSQKQEQIEPTGEVVGGILDLEDILPDLHKRRQRGVSSEVFRRELNSVRSRTKVADRSRKLGGRTAGGAQPTNTRTPRENRERSRTQGGHFGAAVNRRNPESSTAWKRTPAKSTLLESTRDKRQAGPWGGRTKISGSKPRGCRGSIRWQGESGGVLEMLAFMEA